MVRRLVQQQNIGLLHDAFDDREALAPSAGKRAGQCVERFKTGAIERLLGAIAALDFIHTNARESVFNHAAAGGIAGEFGDLLHVAQRRALADRDFSTAGFHAARDNFQERRLSRPVRTDQADAVTRGDGEGNVLEKRRYTEAFREALCIDDGSQMIRVSPALSLTLMGARDTGLERDHARFPDRNFL